MSQRRRVLLAILAFVGLAAACRGGESVAPPPPPTPGGRIIIMDTAGAVYKFPVAGAAGNGKSMWVGLNHPYFPPVYAEDSTGLRVPTPALTRAVRQSCGTISQTAQGLSASAEAGGVVVVSAPGMRADGVEADFSQVRIGSFQMYDSYRPIHPGDSTTAWIGSVIRPDVGSPCNQFATGWSSRNGDRFQLSSSNSNVVAVRRKPLDSYWVVAVARGTATLTATYAGGNATYTYTVTPR